MLGRLWKGIKSGLAKTKGAFTGVFDLLRGKGTVDQAFLDELEKRLYLADVGTAGDATDRGPGPAGVPRQGDYAARSRRS